VRWGLNARVACPGFYDIRYARPELDVDRARHDPDRDRRGVAVTPVRCPQLAASDIRPLLTLPWVDNGRAFSMLDMPVNLSKYLTATVSDMKHPADYPFANE
jgi:hypothetical protein